MEDNNICIFSKINIHDANKLCEKFIKVEMRLWIPSKLELQTIELL